MGELGHFYSAAHQQWKLGETPSHYAQKKIPGGRVRYSNNGGQETLYVDLTYGSPKPENPEVEVKPEPFSPYLAIDVLFSVRSYHGVDINNDPGRTDEYESSGGPFAPEDYDVLDSVDYYVDGPPEERTWGGGFPAIFLRESQIASLDARPIPFNRSVTTLHMIHLKNPDGTDNPFPPFPSPANDPANGGTAIWFVTDYHTTTEVDVYEHTSVDLRNILLVVGAVGDPEKAPYVAASPGVEPPPKQDGRLLALPAKPDPKIEVERAIPIETDPLEGGGFGAGFLAMPTFAADKGVQSPDTIIDIFMASSATMKRNNENEEGATVEGDTPEMKYGYEDHVDFTIQLREFTYGRPTDIGVHTTTEKQTNFNPGDAPEVITVEAGPEADWAFAAEPKWADLGDPNPAAPGALGMGELLTIGGGSVCIVGPSDIRRGPIYSEPEWPGAVSGMTRVARITWKPASAPGVIGEAEIEGFDGIECGHYPEGGGGGG